MSKKAFQPLPSAKSEAKIKRKVQTPQTTASAYRLAFADQEFLLRQELRPVRLQLELLKPEMIQEDLDIRSTIVVFGSARVPSPEEAQKQFKKAKTLVSKKASIENKHLLARAKKRVDRSRYYEEARRFGYIVSSECQKKHHEREFVIVTGGGPGIMEGANRGAFDAKAINIGLNIVLPMEQAPNPYLTPELSFQFHYFAVRKMHFLIRARALVAFPGGYGTLDELFEALTLIQTQKIRPIPIILFGKSFWRRLIDFDFLVEEEMIHPEDLDLFRFVETAEEAWEKLKEYYNTYDPEKSV
jgi:hypothetical protein